MIQARPLLRRLGKAYVDGPYTDDGCRRGKRILEERLNPLAMPVVDAIKASRKLPENLPGLWEEADLSERWKLHFAVLDEV